MIAEEEVDGNVGRIDEYARVGIAAAVWLLVGAGLKFLDVNWALYLFLGGMLATAYLLLSSAAHTDPVYVILGIDTRHRHH